MRLFQRYRLTLSPTKLPAIGIEETSTPNAFKLTVTLSGFTFTVLAAAARKLLDSSIGILDKVFVNCGFAQLKISIPACSLICSNTTAEVLF